jgi:ArsR family transcriptional regulator, arsenate/arsenite/antimonite-responsive transcriptional repressor
MAVDMLPYISIGVNITCMKPLQEIDPCCPPLLSAPFGEDDAETLATTLQALADPARLRLLSLIASCPGSEACGCDLTTPIGLAQPTVSHHLKVLHEAGLLERERRGRWVFYKVRPEPLASLRSALSP